MSITEIKLSARKHLSNYWGKAIGISAIYLLIAIILGEFTKNSKYDTTLIQTIILTFFSLGMISFFFNVIKGNAQIKDLFSQANIYLKGILITLIQSVASIIILFLSVFLPAEHVTNGTVIGIYGIVMLILGIASIIIALMFALSNVILVENPECSIAHALKESNRLMMGNKIKFILLFLSLIGWFILSLLTIGIGFLWLVPYAQMILIEFYLDLKEKKKA